MKNYIKIKTDFCVGYMFSKVHEEPKESPLQKLKELVAAGTTEEIINVLNKYGTNPKN